MSIIRRNLSVPYSVAEMYQLVNDVESYAQFLPWCKNSTVLSRTTEEVRATLTLAGAGLQKSFTTLNRLQENKMIEIRLLDGPFRQLEGFWRFEPLPGGVGCHIMLDLEFEFASRWLDLAFGPMFTQIANTLVDAFSQRAGQIYGADK